MIYELFEFESDNNMEDYSNEIDKYTCDHKRLKRTSESYNRDAKFRKKVLKRYKNQCAICRCNEVKILEAAHIKPVYENGSDNPENGICLCRNHHKMFDSDLIKINFQKNELSFIEDSVKQMPWYKEKYNGKLLKIK